MLAGSGKTTVKRWNAAWSRELGLWQHSTKEQAEAYAMTKKGMQYVVEVTADGYRPFWGTVGVTRVFEELTQGE